MIFYEDLMTWLPCDTILSGKKVGRHNHIQMSALKSPEYAKIFNSI